MKLLMENFRKYLNEIGDLSVAPYDFKFAFEEDEEVYYEFTTDAGTKYDVSFVLFQFPVGERTVAEDLWLISFEIGGDVIMTQENEPLKIMSTIVAVLKDFVASPKLNKGNLKFIFEGIPKLDNDDVDPAAQTGRTKLYLSFLEKNLPADWHYNITGKNIIVFGDHIFWEKKENDEEKEEEEQETF